MTEAEIRAANPTWTDEQVAAEVARLAAAPPAPPAPPEPPKQDPDVDRAMADLRRRAEAAEKRAAEAEAAEAERVRKQAEEEGRWKDLADQERVRADAAVADLAKRDAEALAAEAKNNARTAATQRKFADASYALYLLEAGRIDLTDAAAVSTALDELATRRADLLTVTPPPPPSGGPPAPAAPNGGPGLTREQIAAMSPDQVRKLDPAVVNAALAAP